MLRVIAVERIDELALALGQGREDDALKEFREVVRLPVQLGLDRTIQTAAAKEIPELEGDLSNR